MSIFHGPYVGAKTCTKGPTPGALSLESWFLGAYQPRGGRNDGVFNCRPIRGSKTITSVHGEGRAADLGCPEGAVWAWPLAAALVNYSAELGIQCVIYNRRIWSCAHPDSGWRPYNGVDSHTTHLHVELTWDSAHHLTTKRIRDVLTPEDDVTPADRKAIVDAVVAELLAKLPPAVWNSTASDVIPYNDPVTGKPVDTKNPNVRPASILSAISADLRTVKARQKT